jgi:hypothetical protein
MTETGMSTGDWIGAVQNGVATIAIIAGAIWGYYKFVRGRTFARRAEPSVSAELLSDGNDQAIRASLSLKNTGAVEIPLRLKAVYAYSLTNDGSGGVNEVQIAAERVLKDHDKIEAAETIAEDVLVFLPRGQPQAPAYLVKFLLYESRKKPGATQWTARTVVPATLAPPKREGEDTDKGGTMTQRDEQREEVEEKIVEEEKELARKEAERRNLERSRQAAEEEIERVEQETKKDGS